MTLVNSQSERINVSDSDEVEVKSESDSGSNKESNDELSDLEDGVKSVWADSVAKILKTKKPKGKKTLVLSKARKITDLKRSDPIKTEDIGFQIEGEIKEEKPTLVELDGQGIKSEEPVKKKRKEQARIRIKPDILDKDLERSLTKIATRGVDPSLSTRKLAVVSGVSRTSVQRILKKNKFHPYKIKLVQELNEDDYDRRLQFCEILSDRTINNPNFLFNICFSDECSFFVSTAIIVVIGQTIIPGNSMKYIHKNLKN